MRRSMQATASWHTSVPGARPAGRRRAVTFGVAAVILPLLLAACGSSSAGSTAPAGSSGPGGGITATKDGAVAAMVPAAIASKGTLTIATDASYAPNEFFDTDGTTIDRHGRRPGRSASAQVLGLKVERRRTRVSTRSSPALRPASTTSACPRSPTPRSARRPSTSSTYFSAGTSFWSSRANPGSTVNAWPTCAATRSASRRAPPSSTTPPRRAAKCTDAGKAAVDVQAFPDQNAANLALSSGRVDVGMADSPVGRLPGQAVERPVRGRRQVLRHRAVRHRDPEDHAAWPRRARRAEEADRRRHLHARS